VLDEGTPLFLQIGAQLADDISDGTLAEGERVPSSNEFAAYYRINPATAAKGINVLIDQGLLEKRRGIGMFVAAGARERLLAERRQRFAEQYIEPMLVEARRLGMDEADLVSMVQESNHQSNGNGKGSP
jgi:DNA-binding transcriptional regulator YhcF (GntR family)